MIGFYPYHLMTIPFWLYQCAGMAIWADYGLLALQWCHHVDTNQSKCLANSSKTYGLYIKNIAD